VVTPDERFNAGQFAIQATENASMIYAKGKIPILCGGTGLYVKSMLEGLCHLPMIEPEIKQGLLNRLGVEGLPVLYEELKQLDTDFANTVSPNDKQRIIRGLEVVIATGKPLSMHWSEQNHEKKFKPYRILVSPPRADLYKTIDSRVLQMVSIGLIEEIQSLFAMGYDIESPGLSSLGYKEFIPYIEGTLGLSQCISLAAQHHRNYAKRQMTWYRKYTFDLTLSSPLVNISEMSRLINYH